MDRNLLQPMSTALLPGILMSEFWYVEAHRQVNVELGTRATEGEIHRFTAGAAARFTDSVRVSPPRIH